MFRQGLTEQLSEIAGRYLKERGFELVEIICRSEGSGLVVSILVDRAEGGITLGECAGINRAFGEILEEKGIIQERYLLEVASPGLDRPLKSRADFLRNLSHRAHFFLQEIVEDKLEPEGVIIQVSDDAVSVKIGEKVVDMPLVKINRAKLIV